MKNTANAVRTRKINFLNQFSNMTVSRQGEKRYPLLNCCRDDPELFFSCEKSWQVCTFDFTFRKILSDCMIFHSKKINIVHDYFYG